MERIKLYKEDNLEVMKKLPDESIDVICIDPPYLYLKNQKLERPFDELKFFSECKRLLTKNGFIVMLGRGESFYRWNTILADLKFNFKEEIIWNKRRVSSPVTALARMHETISIFSKKDGVINKSIVNYGEQKAHDLDKIMIALKNLGSLFDKGVEFDKVIANLKKANKSLIFTANKNKTTLQSNNINSCKKTYTLLAMQNGVREQSIISQQNSHYGHIHPTQKPVRLIERLLALVIPQSKPREEIVIADFFGGSMSTMEAVHNMGMQGIACEIDKEYFEDGKARIENLQPNLFNV